MHLRVGVLVTLMAAGPMALGTETAICPGAPGMAGQEANPRYLEQQILDLDNATRQAYADLPWHELRIDAAVDAIGEDPQRLFAWVRDETRWLPYAGALRGAEGVMQDRMGSSLDRALLLAALLEEAGHTARLATTELDAAGREALQSAWSDMPVATEGEESLDADALEAMIAEVAGNLGLESDELAEFYHEGNALHDQTRQRLRAQTRQQQAALEAELDATRASETPADEIGRHWWVQWRSTDGWQHLDPALPTLDPGDRLIGQGEVGHYYPEDVPEEFHHWLVIDVVAERLEGGALHEEVALSHRIATSELGGRQLQLETYPQGMPPMQAILDGGEALSSLSETLLEQDQWLPYLRIGERFERDRIINADGTLEDPTAQTATGAAMSEAAGVLGGIGVGGRDAAEEVAAPELTAVFARFRVTAPGRDTDHFERPLMDLLGPEKRAGSVADFQMNDARREQRAAALLGTLEILGQTHWLPPAQLTAWRYESLLDNRQASLGAAYVALSGDISLMGDMLESRSLRREALDQLAGLRLAWSPHLDAIALTRLNLLGYVSLIDYRGGVFDHREGFDILDNRVEVPSGASAASVRLSQGVLDTLLEAELLAGDTAVRGNTAGAFGDDLDRQRVWLSIRRPEDLDGLDWQPEGDLLAHFHLALDRGQHLVMPGTLDGDAVPTWWQLDPATGDLLGYGPDRRGQYVEGILMMLSAADNAVGAVKMVQQIMACLTDGDPHCCAKKEGASHLIGQMAGRGLAAAVKAQRINIVIGRNIVYGDAFRALNEAGIDKAAGLPGEAIGNLAAAAVGCS